MWPLPPPAQPHPFQHFCYHVQLLAWDPSYAGITPDEITFFEWSPPTDILSDTYSDISILSDVYSDILSGILCGVLSDIWRSPLRSASAHWDLAHAVEVRQCPLRSGARSWDPRLPEEKEKEEEEATLIKSRDPHLAGGEKWLWCTFQLRWSSTVACHDTYKVMSNHLRQDLTWVNKSNLKLEKWAEI